MNKMKLKHFIIIVLLAFIVAACTQTIQNQPNPSTEHVSMKVLHYDESTFFRDYASMFMVKFPHIEIEFIPFQSSNNESDTPMDYIQELEKAIDEHQPDLLWLYPFSYAELASRGMLLDLKPLMQKEQYDVTQLASVVIDRLTFLGEGKLYGLSPQYSSRALFYNKDLFDQYGVAHPHAQMSWKEVLQLAQRFPSDQGVYGFQLYDGLPAAELVKEIGRTKQLDIIDWQFKRVAGDTAGWKEILQMTMEAYKAGVLLQEDGPRGPRIEIESLRQNPFIAGRTAMALYGYAMVETMNQAEQLLNDSVPNWGVVTAPVDPNHPELSPHYVMNEIFAIAAKADHSDAAWEFIKYVLSEEYAVIKSRSIRNQLYTRSLPKDKESLERLEAFTKLKPAEAYMNRADLELSSAESTALEMMLNEEFSSFLQGAKSAEAALLTIEQKGTQLLSEVIQKGEGE